MSERISDERLAELIAFVGEHEPPRDAQLALAEIHRSRELEKQIRALADEMRCDTVKLLGETRYEEGVTDSSAHWLEKLDALLSAHGSAQPEAKS